MSGRHEKERGVNVQVLLRCRPFSDDELRNNAPQVVTCNDYQREVAVSQNIAGKQIDRVFTFDKVFGPKAQQRDLYDQAVVPIVHEVLEGFNCTIFAYGQTGTGKTYTMEGECKRAKSGPNGELPQEAGVIPRAVKQIFDTLEGQNAEYSVKVYATREKNGVYIPKDRYYQEEAERKSMADQIEQMGVTIETHQKNFEELQERYYTQVRHCNDLTSKLADTEKHLHETSTLLANTEEELKKCRYALNERDFVISEQRKAGREDKLQSENRSLVDRFQAELSQQIGCLRSIVAKSSSQQDEHLQSVGNLCHSFLEMHDKRFNSSCDQTKQISEYTDGFLCKLVEQSKTLQNHVTKAENFQMNSIADFQKAYEEQSKSDAEKLVADISNLVSHHILRQKELVNSRLDGFREAAVESKTFLDGQVSSLETMTTEAKRKWQEYCVQAESDAKEGADYSAAKHCRMEILLQQSVSNAETAFQHSKKTRESVNKMCSKHVSSTALLVRDACDANEQHDAEIDSARTAAEQDVATNNEDILQHIDGMSAQEQETVSGVLTIVESHTKAIETFCEEHSSQAAVMDNKSQETFLQRFMDYEPTGTTPVREEPEVPSKGTIESLKAMPMEALVEEFRENNSYDTFMVKEQKPSLIPRPPFVQIN
ncbi:Kinesin-like protein KIN-5C [Linum perenne]